jgi:CRISPR-associated protein Cas1
LCSSNNIPVIFLTTYGLIKGIVLPPYNSSFLYTRLTQVKLNLFNRLEVAKYIVKKKCLEIESTFGLDLEAIQLNIEKIQGFSQLLGIEGYASKLMFNSFSEMLKTTEFTFTERTYNPPPDEVNALLSFVYILGYNLSIGTILIKGFDPYISFLHVKKGAHAAFASDVLEILRPKLTYFVGQLIRENEVLKEDFEKRDNGYFLKKPVLTKILDRFNLMKEKLTNSIKEFLAELEKFKDD